METVKKVNLFFYKYLF